LHPCHPAVLFSPEGLYCLGHLPQPLVSLAAASAGSGGRSRWPIAEEPVGTEHLSSWWPCLQRTHLCSGCPAGVPHSQQPSQAVISAMTEAVTYPPTPWASSCCHCPASESCRSGAEMSTRPCHTHLGLTCPEDPELSHIWNRGAVRKAPRALCKCILPKEKKKFKLNHE
jgi:hypothetical protein